MARKSLKIVASAAPVDRERTIAVLEGAIAIIEAEGLRGLQGYDAIWRAANQVGYSYNLHHHAATLFVQMMNSDEIKIYAMKQAIERLKK